MSETVIREVYTLLSLSLSIPDALFRLHEMCGFSQGSAESALHCSVA